MRKREPDIVADLEKLSDIMGPSLKDLDVERFMAEQRGRDFSEPNPNTKTEYTSPRKEPEA